MQRHKRPKKYKKRRSSRQQRRRLAAFGYQEVPLVPGETGRQVLYRCPTCQQPWLQHGHQAHLRLEESAVKRWAQRLSADLNALPPATCRLCLFQADVGVFEIDEYGAGSGYGFSWEAAEPVGAHLLATVVARSWLEAQPSPPDVVLHPQKARQVLNWLSQKHALQCVHVLSAQESAFIAEGNPPGHQMSGTQGWQWRGGLFLPYCPPLNDTAILTLAIALPADEPLDLAGLVHLWQELAALAAQGHIAGEEEVQ